MEDGIIKVTSYRLLISAIVISLKGLQTLQHLIPPMVWLAGVRLHPRPTF